MEEIDFSNYENIDWDEKMRSHEARRQALREKGTEPKWIKVLALGNTVWAFGAIMCIASVFLQDGDLTLVSGLCIAFGYIVHVQGHILEKLHDLYN